MGVLLTITDSRILSLADRKTKGIKGGWGWVENENKGFIGLVSVKGNPTS